MLRVRRTVGCEGRDIIEGHWSGAGVTAAILDTGVSLHPDLAERVIDWKDVLHGRELPYDDNGHGTHVAGILAGSGACRRGLYAGIAPGAELVCVKVLDHNGNGQIDRVIEGIRYVIRQHRRLRIRIVNISIGTPPHPGDAQEERLLSWVDRLWELGIVVVAAAGNLGPGAGSITLPGVSRKIITVGACDLGRGQNRKRGRVCSGCGPTAECVKKPDVSAPGCDIYSCNYRYPGRSRQPYIRKSGTSMATPVVSGAAALLLEKHPELSNLEVKFRLWNCCERAGNPENLEGHGRIQVGRLLAD